MVNYPNGTKKQYHTKATGAADRGMRLEKDINQTNAFYRDADLAIIYKKPTPVTIVHVDYPARSAAKITEAYFQVPSTTDYNGIYKGRYIDFEAKECAQVTSFPIKCIHAHQIAHLDAVKRHGAISFVIVRFTTLNETWLVDSGDMSSYIKSCGRSSIPYAWFKENATLIPYNYLKPVDYLGILDRKYLEVNT